MVLWLIFDLILGPGSARNSYLVFVPGVCYDCGSILNLLSDLAPVRHGICCHWFS